MTRPIFLFGFLLGILPASLFAVQKPFPKLQKLPSLRSESVLIQLVDTKEILLSKQAEQIRPIASVTKILSGLVLANKKPLATKTTIEESDKDLLKHAHSRLRVGWAFTQDQLLQAALLASDNRAMYAAVRNTGLERHSFVEEMNTYAQSIGMTHSQFFDPAGLDPRNVSTASDLLKLLEHASQDSKIRSLTTQGTLALQTAHARVVHLINPNRLARSKNWELVLGKTGYTNEAGRTLIARVKINQQLVDMVFLGAHEKASVFGDASRIKKWLLARRS